MGQKREHIRSQRPVATSCFGGSLLFGNGDAGRVSGWEETEDGDDDLSMDENNGRGPAKIVP